MDRRSRTTNAQDRVLRCSFCSKSRDEVKKLIAGPDVYICDECVEVCAAIIADEVQTESGAPPGALPSDTLHVCALCAIAWPPEQTTIIRRRGTIVCKACIAAILETVTDSR